MVRDRVPRVGGQISNQTAYQSAQQSTNGNEENPPVAFITDSMTTFGSEQAQSEPGQTAVAEAREKT